MSAAKLRTEFIDLGDLHMAYHQTGSGRVLLLLHGNSGSKHNFKDYQLKHFPMFQTIALDSRGHGQSQSLDEQLTYLQLSQDVIHFCQTRGIQQADVIGYSDGGNIAILLAHQAPQMFPHLVSISPNYLVSGTTESSLRLMARIVKLLTFFGNIGFNVKKQLLRFDLMLHDIGISEEELQSIQSEVKILYAEDDMIKEAHIQRLAKLIPHASLHKVKGCNHLTILNNPEALRIIKSYLPG